jgi:hypothetical protein
VQCADLFGDLIYFMFIQPFGLCTGGCSYLALVCCLIAVRSLNFAVKDISFLEQLKSCADKYRSFVAYDYGCVL